MKIKKNTSTGPSMDLQWIFNGNGSIMIWSVLLGFLLTSVFFFFGVRQRLNTEVQQDTTEILNTRAYMETYANYLQNNPTPITQKTYDGIDVKLIKKQETVAGNLDFKEQVTYNFIGDIFIRWNRCGENQVGFFSIDGKTYLNNGGGCAGNEEFDDTFGPINIGGNGDFTIINKGGPFDYEITNNSGGLIEGDEWHLSLTKTLSNNQIIKIQRTF